MVSQFLSDIDNLLKQSLSPLGSIIFQVSSDYYSLSLSPAPPLSLTRGETPLITDASIGSSWGKWPNYEFTASNPRLPPFKNVLDEL